MWTTKRWLILNFKQWAAKKGRIDQSVLDEPKDVLMEKLHLMNGPYLTNAAMLLFSRDVYKRQISRDCSFFITVAHLLLQTFEPLFQRGDASVFQQYVHCLHALLQFFKREHV